MNFFRVFILEFVSNVPIWFGFIGAVKLLCQPQRIWWQGILTLFASAMGTSTLILLVEPLKLGGSAPGILYPVQILELAAVFTIMGLPALWYIINPASESPWKTDLALAVSVGLLLTIGEALVVNIWDARILLLHSISMTIATGVTLPMLRLLMRKPWLIAFGGTTMVTILVSGLIVVVEYIHPPYAAP